MSNEDDRDTPVSSFEPPSRPSWELGAEHYAQLVTVSMREEIAPIKSALMNLTDAFHQHTDNEDKFRAAMTKALVAKSLMPTLALLAAVAALTLSLVGFSQPAQAGQRICSDYSP